MKTKFYFIIRLIISLGALFFLLWYMRDRIGPTLNVLRTIRLELFAAAFLMQLFCLLISSLRLKVILGVQDINLSLAGVFKLNLIGIFFNNFLPTSAGGDIVKAHYISKKSLGYLEPFSAIITDRLVGALTFTLLASAAFLFAGKYVVNAAVKWLVLIMLLAVTTVIFVLTNRSAGKKISSILKRFHFLKFNSYAQRLTAILNNYKKKKKVFFQAMLLSLAAQLITVITNYLLAKSLSLSIPLRVFLLLVPVICATSSILPSLNGLGIREGAYIYFFSGIIQPEKALAISVLWLVMLLISSVFGSISYLIGKPLKS
ncbi:MAG: lysylphosphatidylglycerol synthase transmembrane domain-containing protein [Candidatus Omnitrophota bacterium]|nr:lysylphosphatidylglycerol synthase transmembrane domain-containing protein [Candidatus Omnitrophota bacterium]